LGGLRGVLRRGVNFTKCRADIPDNNGIQVIILVRKQVVTAINDRDG